MSIEKLIEKAVKCTICGTKGYMICDCWVKCKCGWLYEKGTKCKNPIHKTKTN